MPGSTQNFFKTFLGVLRLNPGDNSESNSTKQTVFEHNVQGSSVNASLLEMGYSDNFMANIAPFLIAMLAVTLLWALYIIYLKEKYYKKSSADIQYQKNDFLNVVCRLVYFFFLELWVSCFLSLGLFKSGVDFALALVLVWLLLVTICLYPILFFKSGPFLKN